MGRFQKQLLNDLTTLLGVHIEYPLEIPYPFLLEFFYPAEKGSKNLFSGGISSFLAEYPRSLGGTLDENVLYLHIVNNI